MHAKLPARVRDSGKLMVVTNAPYAPMEFLDAKGHLVGFDIDVMNEIAKTLGVTATYDQVPFESLQAKVADGTFDIGMRALFDTKAREQQTDLVTYFSAGTLWASHSGKTIDPTNACGLRVAAESGTVQFSAELPAKSRACEITGDPKISIVGFASQDDANQAVIRGDADAVSADSPVIEYAIGQSGGKLVAAGSPFDTEPYSYPVAHGSALGPVIADVVQKLIDNGRITEIANKWGIKSGVISKSLINGATS